MSARAKPRARPSAAAVVSAAGGTAASPLAWLALAVILGFVMWVRLRLSATPLERDEGEYAYMAQLLLKGFPPYAMAYSMKLPGMYLAYALIMSVFGQTASGVHVGFALVNAGAIVFVFLIGRRLLDDLAGVTAAAGYALMTLSPSVLGTSAHATHFVVLPALVALWIILPRNDATAATTARGILRPALAGALFGIAFLMKQPGLLWLGAGLGWSWLAKRARPVDALRESVALGLGAAVPVVLVAAWLVAAGVGKTAWFWVFTYARTYAAEVMPQDAWLLFAKTFLPMFRATPFVWVLAGMGLVLPFGHAARRQAGGLLILLFVCSAVAASLTFNFRAHYFVLVLPAVALLAGAAVSGVRDALARRMPLAAATGVLALGFAFASCAAVAQERAFYLELSPEQACRRLYGSNPFPESLPIAEYLKAHSHADDRILVLGSEPQIYFYADRLSATGHIYMYGLMEVQPHAVGMQQELIRQVEATKPRFVLFVTATTTWLRKPDSPHDLFQWTSRYLSSQHRLVGVIEMPTPEAPEPRYFWDEAAMTHRSTASNRILVYERDETVGR